MLQVIVAGDAFTFASKRELTIGRAPDADVRLSSPYVSRRHGHLIPVGDRWVYEDLGSHRGTWHKGERVTRMVLVGPVTLLLGGPGRGEEVHVQPDQTSTIFVCYRRDDAAGHAGRLRDQLAERFGPDQVFLDIDNIGFGEDFRVRITRTVAACRVVLVVIGRDWLTATDSSGRRRLDDPEDSVRLEIGTALASGPTVHVIPVLVRGAGMPAEESLPEELRPLTRRNALVAADERWRSEVGRLVDTLEEILRGALDPADVRASVEARPGPIRAESSE